MGPGRFPPDLYPSWTESNARDTSISLDKDLCSTQTQDCGPKHLSSYPGKKNQPLLDEILFSPRKAGLLLHRGRPLRRPKYFRAFDAPANVPDFSAPLCVGADSPRLCSASCRSGFLRLLFRLLFSGEGTSRIQLLSRIGTGSSFSPNIYLGFCSIGFSSSFVTARSSSSRFYCARSHAAAPPAPARHLAAARSCPLGLPFCARWLLRCCSPAGLRLRSRAREWWPAPRRHCLTPREEVRGQGGGAAPLGPSAVVTAVRRAGPPLVVQ